MQRQIIDAVLKGEDVLALLPTGGGKSVCFQVPALAREGVCLVISPLIALMKDQVESLTAKGIPALSIYSGMTYKEVERSLENALTGYFKFLYVSPERLRSEKFLNYLREINISLIAIDEAHCISQWGYDFRPSYLEINKVRAYFPDVNFIALTASATELVQQDICDKLSFRKGYRRFMQSFERPNLSYSVFTNLNKETKLLQVLQNVPGTGIVYCRVRRQTERIAALLQQNGISADHYHAGLANTERELKQQNWIENKTRVIVCTNAFGMGIDKPDVRSVVHFDVPDSLENYYQEAGRAGRDGKRSYAVLLSMPDELQALREEIETRYPDVNTLKSIYAALYNHLQVAAGGGAGAYFEFDMQTFATNFKLNILQVSYALKYFEQEGLLVLNEGVKRPTTLQFTANRQDIETFNEMYPRLRHLVLALLRSYSGILNHPVIISEKQLARFTGFTEEELPERLQFIATRGIVDYTPSTDKPGILLLQNRMYADAWSPDMQKIRTLKKMALERLDAIAAYVKEGELCRSKKIAAYFGSHIAECCICDNCISRQHKMMPPETVKDISSLIENAVQKGPVKIKELLFSLRNFNKVDAWKVISMLEARADIIRKLDTFYMGKKRGPR